MLSGIAIGDLAHRVSQVALPLVVMTATGSAAATGLVAGATGVPVITSPWWARRLRHRIRTGRAIAACYLGEATALAAVPTAAALGVLTWWWLVAAGLALGLFEAMDGPARDALLADIGDDLGPDRAFGLLNTRQFFRRLGMIAGPAVGGVGVATGHSLLVLWAESVTVVGAAVLAAAVRKVADGDRNRHPRIWAAVRTRADILTGWTIRGTGCLLWFSFTLGLALLGVDRGHPGLYLATAMTCYGAGSVAGTVMAVPLLRRLPPLPSIAVAWGATGGCWSLIAVHPHLGTVATCSVVSGVAVVIGNAGVTAQITRTAAGSDRRTLLAGQAVVVNSTSSLGMLAGGALLGAFGPTRVLLVAGLVLSVVTVTAVRLRTWIRSRGSAVRVRSGVTV